VANEAIEGGADYGTSSKPIEGGIGLVPETVIERGCALGKKAIDSRAPQTTSIRGLLQ